jgi:ABC-type polysaccharide/polyol phosphate transport system ATPase subunit
MPSFNTAGMSLPMRSDIAISVTNLTKTYRIFGHPSDRIKQALTLGRMRFHREFTALQDVSFEIQKGETVGIIGRNGSGKSTLLQLICGILKPTSGEVQVNGRISALLELGAGFNPEFTGRENVYFQGAVLGISKVEMDARFDEIVSFADIGEFIDQPVRTYSSGMYVRLAFAVAVSVEPDVLVVDEALAVGDIAFQRKCFERIRQLLSTKQCIVLFVSHDLRQVERFCSRVIFFQNGQVVADGLALDVCQKYYDQMSGDMKNESAQNKKVHAKITSSGEAELQRVTINDFNGNEIQEIPSGAHLHVRVRFKLLVPLRQPEFIIGTQAADLSYLSSSSTAELDTPLYLEPGEHTVEYLLDQFPLAPGQYFIRFGIRDEHTRLMFAGEGLCPFHVIPDSFEFKRPSRLLNLKTEWIVGGVNLPTKFSSTVRQ